ncbi:MAG: ABC transporter substrate-binding protein [Alphaproteobacteria bacterium]
MDHVHFPYRSPSHLLLTHVIAESGAWEKHGLEVEYDYGISSADAHDAVAAGTVEFVDGNHMSPYARRADGDQWVYLAQSTNKFNHKLVTKPDSGIEALADVRGRVMASNSQHSGFNDWLYLKRHGLDPDQGAVTLKTPPKALPMAMNKWQVRWSMVAEGEADAAFITPPQTLFAARAGLRVIDIEPLAMINFTTISSGMPFVAKHGDIVERFIKGTLEGIAFFLTQPDKATTIIQDRFVAAGALDFEAAAHIQAEFAAIFEPKMYPELAAIENMHAEAVHKDAKAAKAHPLELWDLDPLRRIDDSGFIDDLYKDHGGRLAALEA